ncbi:MAG: metallophosphatase family protein [Deltaproteobacteria bacterium]|jgi:predicted phosphodiesterase|nr:metallophosphatase family protein [Deltaproteobacteria bacterium]
MRIAIFADIHGNIEFFTACLNKMRELEADAYYFLGDAIGYMPSGLEVLSKLKQINAKCLMGNHEAMFCNFLEYNCKQEKVYQFSKLLQHKLNIVEEIKNWLPFRIETMNELNILFVHGSPYNPLQGYIYLDSPERYCDFYQYDFVFCAHSHQPFISINKHTTLVNVGSCGLPRDIGNSPAFVLLDTITREIRIIRLNLNIDTLLLDLKSKGVHQEVINCFLRKG